MKLIPFVLLVLFGLACHGWGCWLRKFCFGKTSETSLAFDIALGLAVLGALGGLLNLWHAATPVSLCIVAVTGPALSLDFIRRAVKDRKIVQLGERWHLWTFLPHTMVLCSASFFCLTLVPSAAFNYADDMHTYLVRPLRMLATGTIGGNRFEMLGLDSLGAQSFFQSFFLLFGPLTWINEFDAVFCFALSGLLILDVARRLNVHWGFSLLAVLVFVALNPQIVNVSTVYSGSAMILAAFLAAWRLADGIDSAEARAAWKLSLPLGLTLAMLLALKNTFAFLLVVQVPLFFALLWRATHRRKAVLVSAATTAAVITFLLLPWLAVTLGGYGFPGNWPGHDFAPTPLMTKYPSLAAHDIPGLFKFQELFYGGHRLIYGGLVLSIALSGAVAFFCGRSAAAVVSSFAIPFAASAGGAVAAYFLNAHVNFAQIAVRYCCPIFLALFPVAGLVLAHLFATRLTTTSSPAQAANRAPAWRLVPVLVPTAAFVLFLPLCINRFEQAYKARCLLAFPIDQNLLRYSYYAMGPSIERVRSFQDQTEPGTTILAWTAQPFQLDFKRNRVLNVCNPGLVNPLLRFPAGVTESQLIDYLRSLGVRYVLHQFQGAGVVDHAQLRIWRHGDALHRSIAEYNIYLAGLLRKLSEEHPPVHRDDQTVLFDLEQNAGEVLTRR